MPLKFYSCVFIALALGNVASAEKCPAKEDIFPCTCENTNNDARMTCKGIPNAQVLREALAGTKGTKMYSLEVRNSYLGDVPGHIFEGTHFELVEIAFATMTSLGDDDKPPFSGLENSMKSLTIREGFWDYDKPLTKPLKFGHLKKLTYLKLESNIIPKIGNDWFGSGPFTLRDLFISMARCEELGDKAFASLVNLRNLHFTSNLVAPARSALPAKAPFMDSLDLKDNEIQELPSDIFDDFPALKYVYLDYNALKSLPESTWKKIMPQLDFVFLHSNPLVCDSEMKWLIDAGLQEKIIGECALPHRLTGKAIGSLTADDITK